MKQKKCFLGFVFFSFLSISTLFAQYDFMHTSRFSGAWEHPGFIPVSPHYVLQPHVVFEFRAPNKVESTFAVANIQRFGTYSIVHEYGVPFISFYWDDGTQECFLMLINEYMMVLYKDNTMPVFVGLRYYDTRHRPFYRITASSTLREGHIVYAATPERLGFHINRVWAVEGGIGEKLFVSRSRPIQFALMFSIGYVHFSRPYLFQHNSRPKRVRISSIQDETRYIEHEFKDTPNFQLIQGNSIMDAWWMLDEIKIEILEIFPGTRFNHMCINSIIDFNPGGR